MVFQPSPAVSSRCNRVPGRQVAPLDGVSTLTGCFQPVQQGDPVRARERHDVSTLTGCFQPVQLPTQAFRGTGDGFNPHRLFPAGATCSLRPSPASNWQFQPSPAVSSRCNNRASTAACALSIRFNPHRLFPAGATALADADGHERKNPRFNPHRLFPAGATLKPRQVLCRCLFQPSPAVSSRCNARPLPGQCVARIRFQPSPAVSSRCNRRSPPSASSAASFNPHRLFPAGATARDDP